MEKFAQLGADIAKLWSKYGTSHYLPGIRNTLILALVATLIGCVIGFVCAVAAELAATAGMSLIDWEAEWAESGTALAVGMVCAAALAVIVLLVMKRNKERNAAC